MTVLVTGSAVYIGSHMVHALVDAGKRVAVLDNLATVSIGPHADRRRVDLTDVWPGLLESNK
jgi:UDP-glucose 4-epimerase